jgi:uncharacterized protein YndB with AHSA1/START domain
MVTQTPRHGYWGEALEGLRTAVENADSHERGSVMDIDVNVRERILKPVGDVFAAIVDPAKMTNYFISGASGPLRPNTRVQWEFADVSAKVPVDVIEVDENRTVMFDWDPCGSRTRVTIRLTADDDNTTVVAINEATFPFDQEGVKRALGQNAGWTYTLCCLKAYLQFGINLRLGLNKRLTEV